VEKQTAMIYIGPTEQSIREVMKAIDYLLNRKDLDKETKQLALLCLNASIKYENITISNCHFESKK
jgi:hypothetical protein